MKTNQRVKWWTDCPIYKSHVVRVILTVIIVASLLVAVFYKVANKHQILLGDGILSNPILFYLTIIFEVIAAILVSLSSWKRARKIALLVFGTFAIVSGYAVVTGRQCNCFGNAITSEVVFVFDISLVIICWVIKPVIPNGSLRNIELHFSVPFSVLIAIFVAFLAAKTQLPSMNSLLVISASNESIGKKLLVIERFAELSFAAFGDWIVLIIDPDCEHCNHVLEKLRTEGLPEDGLNFLVLRAGRSRWSYFINEYREETVNDQFIDWGTNQPFVSFPAVFTLSNGLVTACGDNEGAERLVLDIWKNGVRRRSSM